MSTLPFLDKLRPLFESNPWLAQLQKVKVNRYVVIGAIGVVLVLAGVWLSKIFFHTCLTCPTLQGKYQGIVVMDSNKASVTIDLMQEGNFVAGSAMLQFQEGENSGKQVTLGLVGSDLSGNHIRLATNTKDRNRFVYEADVSSNGLQGEVNLELPEIGVRAERMKFTGNRKP